MLVLVLTAQFALATPLRPNLKKLLSQPPPDRHEYIPARAGWDGPELKDLQDNLYVERYSPEASARAVRAGLIAAAVPDWRAVLVIAALILVLRYVGKATEEREQASNHQPTTEMPKAA